MLNDAYFQSTPIGLNAMEFSPLVPSLDSLFLDDTPRLGTRFTSGPAAGVFTGGSAGHASVERDTCTKETVVDALQAKPHVKETRSVDTSSEYPRDVEYYGFRTGTSDRGQRVVFFDIKTGEIAFGEEVVKAIPLDAIARFEQVGEPTLGVMKTQDLSPARRKLAMCAAFTEKASCRIAIGSVIVGAAAGLISFVFPPALPIASFLLTKSLYPALAHYAAMGIGQMAHIDKQVKFECTTKPELPRVYEHIAGVRFTGTLPANAFNFVTEQLSDSKHTATHFSVASLKTVKGACV